MGDVSISINSLFIEQRESLIHSIYRIVGCLQTAEDLAHEAYIKLQQAHQKQDINYPQPFLYKVARNLALDYLRSQNVRKETIVIDEDVDYMQQISSLLPTPEQQALLTEQVNQMTLAIEELSERRREIFVLYRFHEWSYDKIAAHLNLSRSAVEKNIRAAMAHLMVCMDNNG